MRKLLVKVKNVYKNNGLGGLTKKTAGYMTKRLHRLGRAARGRGNSEAARRLQQEYDFVANDIFEITEADIAASKKVTSGPALRRIRSAVWFVPYFEHFGFNGIQTIFRFIEKLSSEGVKCTIVVYDRPTLDVAQFEHQITLAFPLLTDYEIVVFGDDKQAGLAALPESDISFCTFWVSAYLLLRYNKTKRKYYFIQDYEAMFYEAGTTYALAQSTYRFGFRGVVNTPGLLAAVNQRHGMEGISFIPTVNQELYRPNPAKKNSKVRIFLYTRPFNPRNAFTLGVLTIQKLLDKYGSKIEIITAGAEWNEAEYGLKGRITNLGLIPTLQGVADVYRTCDIGFAYMLTPHTSYQMLEYSASGMATVMNRNEDHGWLHKDGVNCLLAEPSPADMAEKIGRLVDDPKLRARLVKNAQKELAYSWEQQMNALWNDVKSY